MSQSHLIHRQTRGVLWDVLLALLFGGLIFAALIITTGGVVVASVTSAVAIMIAFGWLHYFLWGRLMLKSMAPKRRQADVHARVQHERATPRDEFALELSDRERVALISALEQSLGEPAGMKGTRLSEKETIREVLDRLRGFGA